MSWLDRCLNLFSESTDKTLIKIYQHNRQPPSKYYDKDDSLFTLKDKKTMRLKWSLKFRTLKLNDDLNF